MTGNYFTELAAVDCSRNIEKKGRFSYLSWPFAITELLSRHPDAAWRVIENAEGWPYWATPAGVFVKVGVTVSGVERVQIHPVLDGNNKSLPTPNAFQINTSIQRALVKAIALHGLGLSIYAGEDVPASGPTTNDQPASEEQQASVSDWQDYIAGASTPAELAEIGKQLAASSLSAAARKPLKDAWAARMRELQGAP